MQQYLNNDGTLNQRVWEPRSNAFDADNYTAQITKVYYPLICRLFDERIARVVDAQCSLIVNRIDHGWRQDVDDSVRREQHVLLQRH